MKLISNTQSVLEAHRCSILELREQNALLNRQVQHKNAEIKRRIDLANDLKRAVTERRRAEERAEVLRQELDKRWKQSQRLQNENWSLKERINEHPTAAANTRAEKARKCMYWERGIGLVAWEEDESRGSVWSSLDSPRDEPLQPLPSYMMGTVASRARSCNTKRGPQDQQQHKETSNCASRSSSETVVDDSYCQNWNDSITPRTNVEYVEPKPHETLLPDHAWHRFLKARLGSQPCITAWTDDGWLKGPAGTVKLRSQFSKALLTDALDLAAEIWHAWGQAHQPEFMARYAPEGWWDLLLDRSTLNGRRCGVWDVWKGNHFDPAPSSWRVSELLYGSIGELRNRTYHFTRDDSTWPKRLHELVHPVLAFAKELEDHVRADRAKALLKRLFEEAGETYAFIERNQWLAELPGAQPWPHHYQELFATVRDSIAKHVDRQMAGADTYRTRLLPPCRYGSAVLRVAWHDNQRPHHVRQVLGEWDDPVSADRRADLSVALGYCQSHYGRNSPQNVWARRDGRTVHVERRVSVSGSDCKAMARAGWARSRWKDRSDPRTTLGWLDLAIKI